MIKQSFSLLIFSSISLVPTSAFAVTISSIVPSVMISGFNKDVTVVEGGVVEGDISGSGLYHDITLDGGTVKGNISFSGFEHEFTLLDGELGGNLTFSGFDHIVNIFGLDGELDGNLIFSGFDHTINISGGTFGGGSSGSGSRHIFNIYGSRLTSTKAVGSPISGSSTISGFLEDGSAFNYNISIGGTYTVNLFNTVRPASIGSVPEPLTIMGAGTAIAFGGGFKLKLAKANVISKKELLP